MVTPSENLIEPKVAVMPDLSSFLMQHWPELIPLALVVYGSVVLVITTTLLAAGIVRACLRLRNAQTREQLTEAFAQSRLEHLLTRILDLGPSDVFGERVVIQSPFTASRARREIAHLYRGRLARVRFFTAAAALFVIAGFSWMQDYAAIANSGTTLPPFLLTAAAALALALFGSLGYLAIDAAAKRLVDKISELPMERVEITWLRRLTTFLEQRGLNITAPANNSLGGFEQLLEKLNETVDRHSRSLHASVLQLSAAAEGFTQTLKAWSESPPLSIQARTFEKVGEINAGIDRLATELDRLNAAPRPSSLPRHPNGADTDSVKQELHDLIKRFK